MLATAKSKMLSILDRPRTLQEAKSIYTAVFEKNGKEFYLILADLLRQKDVVETSDGKFCKVAHLRTS